MHNSLPSKQHVQITTRLLGHKSLGRVPTFELKPLEAFVGREAASEIYRRLPTIRPHRALHDATALMNACRAFFEA